MRQFNIVLSQPRSRLALLDMTLFILKLNNLLHPSVLKTHAGEHGITAGHVRELTPLSSAPVRLP